MDQPRAIPALLARVQGTLCAFPLVDVIETMRPLPIEPLANTPDFVLGVARIRGVAVPVVRLSTLFQEKHFGDHSNRFVTIRVGQRCVAVAMESVLGIADLSDQTFGNLPPLLQTGKAEFIQALSTLDNEFLVVLDAARIVPDSVWRELAQTKALQ
jgi:purine-binding chemotaxis protein CheW